MYAITCYDPEQYDSYKAALVDGATDRTGSTIDATDTLTGLYDIIEVVNVVFRKIGKEPVILGIIEKGIWIPLTDIISEIELTPGVLSVDEAIGDRYKALTTVTITFTLEEVVELTHRVNLSSSVLATVYRHDDYTSIDIPAKRALFNKLNEASKSPI